MDKCSRYCICEYARKGFKFQPSDQQICEFYLKSKIEGRPLPCSHLIAEENMYEDYSTPWEILKNDDPHWLLVSESSSNNSNKKKIKKTIYVFTKLKKRGERVLRKAGCGTWTGQNLKDVENEEGLVIGSNKLLTFEIKDETKKKKKNHGHWTMHQYCLKPHDYDYALCKITKEEDEQEEDTHEKAAAAAEYYNQNVGVAPVVDQQPYLINAGSSNMYINLQEEFLDNNIDAAVAVQEFPNENMLNQADPHQVLPLSDQELDSYTSMLNQLLEEEEEEGERGPDQINILKQFPNNIDAAEVQEFPNENMFNQTDPQVRLNQGEVLDDYSDMVNELAQPQGEEEQETRTYNNNNNIASDPVVQLPPDYELVPTTDMHAYCNFSNDQHVLLVQEAQSDELPLSKFLNHVAANFDYYYDQQQQQQPEGCQHNSLGKRKNCSYNEEEFSNKKKQQLTFGCI